MIVRAMVIGKLETRSYTDKQNIKHTIQEVLCADPEGDLRHSFRVSVESPNSPKGVTPGKVFSIKLNELLFHNGAFIFKSDEINGLENK